MKIKLTYLLHYPYQKDTTKEKVFLKKRSSEITDSYSLSGSNDAQVLGAKFKVIRNP